MLANLPVTDADTAAGVKAEADKAAAADTMPPAKRRDDDDTADTDAGRVARRGQDPPEPEKAADDNS